MTAGAGGRAAQKGRAAEKEAQQEIQEVYNAVSMDQTEEEVEDMAQLGTYKASLKNQKGLRKENVAHPSMRTLAHEEESTESSADSGCWKAADKSAESGLKARKNNAGHNVGLRR